MCIMGSWAEKMRRDMDRVDAMLSKKGKTKSDGLVGSPKAEGVLGGVEGWGGLK